MKTISGDLRRNTDAVVTVNMHDKLGNDPCQKSSIKVQKIFAKISTKMVNGSKWCITRKGLGLPHKQTEAWETSLASLQSF